MSATGYISHLKKFAIHDGPGIRTTVFFMGCPLSCWWCHNPDCRIPLDQSSQLSEYAMTLEELMTKLIQDVIFYQESTGGITISGGEPLMQIEFLESLLTACRKSGIHTAVDTCGQAPKDHFRRIMSLVDLFLFDIKVIDSELHREHIGVFNKLILENLELLAAERQSIRIRLPLIPGISDTEDNLQSIGRYLGGLEGIRHVDLLPYNPMGVDTQVIREHQLTGLKTQSQEALAGMRELLVSCGLDAYIGGGA